MGDKKVEVPEFSENEDYENWTRRINWWKIQTTVAADKQGVAVACTLKGKALDAVLQLADTDINCADGLKNVITKLDAVYKKNSLTKKIEDIEKFETLKRKDNATVKEYIAEFDKCVAQLKTHKIEYPKDVKGYKLLKGANVPAQEEKMIRAACTDIDYDLVYDKLKQIYGDERPTGDRFNLKAEPTFIAESQTYEERSDEDDDTDDADVMYTSARRRNGRDKPSSRYNPSGGFQSKRQPSNSSSGNWRDRQEAPKGKNPLSKNGNQTRCRICQSINHWESKCPDKDSADTTLLVNEIILMNNDVVLKSLLAETWSSAVLDCGATNTVCGSKWMEEFVESLPPEQREKVKTQDSSKPFRFGDGVVMTSKKKAIIPVTVGEKSVSIATEIIDADIPLLLSIKSMKTAKMGIDFDSDQLSVFGQKIQLQTTSNGLYSLALTKPSQLMTSFCTNEQKYPIVLKVTESSSNEEIAKKLHRSFAHPSAERLLRMVNSAGEKWAKNDDLKAKIREVTEECSTCKIFKKAPARPAVGMPMASQFNETVAMDLKQYDGRNILHLVDLCTRLSAAIFIPNKKASTVVDALFKIWICVYGSPIGFLSDNGGEFANAEFLSLCESFNVKVKTTAAESPWSNGTVERNNQTIARSMDKIIEDTRCTADLAL